MPKIWTPKWYKKRELNKYNYVSLFSLDTTLGLDRFLLVNITTSLNSNSEILNDTENFPLNDDFNGNPAKLVVRLPVLFLINCRHMLGQDRNLFKRRL